MEWKKRLQQGSFRNITFYTQESSGQGGRRVALHEYPQQEQHYAEDIGKKAESEKLKVFLIGTDYDLARDKLLKALNQPGTGELVHPHLGKMPIQVMEYDWTISTRQGGYCEFNIQYVRTGKRVYPTAVSESVNILQVATKKAEEAAKIELSNTFDIDNTPAFVKSAALQQMNTAIDSLSSLNEKIGGYVESVSSSVADDIDSFANDVGKLLGTPALLAEELIAIVSDSFEEMPDMEVVFDSYNKLLTEFASTELTLPKILTPHRQQELKNKLALDSLLISSSTIAATKMLVNENYIFTTINQAQAARDQLLTQLDYLIDNGTDEAYSTLADLQTAIMRRVDALEPNLARVNTAKLEQSLPTLVMAYNLYGDARREVELIKRNGIKNPNIIKAGVDIEVLK